MIRNILPFSFVLVHKRDITKSITGGITRGIKQLTLQKSSGKFWQPFNYVKKIFEFVKEKKGI